jgi:hypothetical protein
MFGLSAADSAGRVAKTANTHNTPADKMRTPGDIADIEPPGQEYTEVRDQ